ncbi:MAG: hypothetical protein GC161_16295 [Planctomycetaceae bacterium]|nr:hypothetical protein [Planctomycetaceae bacterium]
MNDRPYPSFAALVEAEVLPRLAANPGHVRLDGGESVGSEVWNTVGSFMFDGDEWEVFVDNHYEPLLLAYWSARFRGEDRTFRRADTKTRVKLELADDLRKIRPGRHQYLYLYRRGSRAAA